MSCCCYESGLPAVSCRQQIRAPSSQPGPSSAAPHLHCVDEETADPRQFPGMFRGATNSALERVAVMLPDQVIQLYGNASRACFSNVGLSRGVCHHRSVRPFESGLFVVSLKEHGEASIPFPIAACLSHLCRSKWKRKADKQQLEILISLICFKAQALACVVNLELEQITGWCDFLNEPMRHNLSLFF